MQYDVYEQVSEPLSAKWEFTLKQAFTNYFTFLAKDITVQNTQYWRCKRNFQFKGLLREIFDLIMHSCKRNDEPIVSMDYITKLKRIDDEIDECLLIMLDAFPIHIIL